MKVLYIACNPQESNDLALEREITELQRKALQYSAAPAQFHFMPSLPFEELPMALSAYAPDILHFSAHGENGTLQMANAAGKPVQVTAKMLQAFLKYDRPPKLVYLNACSSSTLARAIVDCGSVPMSIGTTAPITNRAARAAAVLFYDRILMGSTVLDAATAGQNLMEGLQEAQVSSDLYCAAGVDPGVHRLFSVPRLVAKPDGGRFKFDKAGMITLELQLIGAPPNTTQVVFFTDDKSFIFSNIKKTETDGEYLARELCQVVRITPKRGVIYAPDLWTTDEDFHIYACATTADGKAFSVASSLCDAIEDYAKYVNCALSSGELGSSLIAAVRRLQDPDQILMSETAAVSSHVAAKPETFVSPTRHRTTTPSTSEAASKPAGGLKKAPEKLAVISPATRVFKAKAQKRR
jgi:hypothetical protein